MKELIEKYQLRVDEINKTNPYVLGATNRIFLDNEKTFLMSIIADLTKLQDKQISPPATAKRIVITFE